MMGIIYALVLRDEPLNYRYIGLTSRSSVGSRFREHLYAAAAGQDDYPVHRWIRKHGSEKVGYRELEWVLDGDLDDWEIYYIDLFRRAGYDLLNIADGGNRPKKVYTEEMRAELSVRYSGREAPWAIGENNAKAKLTDGMVRSILEQPSRSNSDLAHIFGVSIDSVIRVRNNKSWKHVDRSEFPDQPTGRKARPGRKPGGKQKLTEGQVAQIKSRLRDGKRGIGIELAKEYGVKPKMISRIKSGQSWGWVDLD